MLRRVLAAIYQAETDNQTRHNFTGLENDRNYSYYSAEAERFLNELYVQLHHNQSEIFSGEHTFTIVSIVHTCILAVVVFPLQK